MPRSALRRDVMVALIAILAGALYVAAAGGGFPLDDSWIHQVYGRSVGLRGEWAFVPGEISTASTSPLYTVLLAVGYRLGVPFVLYTHGLGILALAGMAVLAARLAARLIPQVPLAAPGVGLAIALTWNHIWAAGAGMEAIILMMLTFWLFHRTTVEAEADEFSLRRAVIFGGSVGLAALARPEGMLLGAVCGLTLLALRPRGLGDIVRFGVVAVLVCGIVLAPYLMFNLQQTGGLLPNTGAAKIQGFAALLDQPLHVRYWSVFSQMIVGPQALWALGVIPYAYYALQTKGQRRALLLLPLLWYVSHTLLYAIQLPVPMQHGRYFLPALPSLVFCGALGLLWWASAARRRMLPRVLSRVAVLSAALVTAAFAAVLGLRAYVNDVTFINQEQVRSALWIRDNLPADGLLALYDIGAVGYFSGRADLLDVAGLISPDIIPLLGDAEAMWNWLETNGATHFFGFPYQIPGADPTDPRLCPLFTSDSAVTRAMGEPSMSVYRIAWDRDCGAANSSNG